MKKIEIYFKTPVKKQRLYFLKEAGVLDMFMHNLTNHLVNRFNKITHFDKTIDLSIDEYIRAGIDFQFNDAPVDTFILSAFLWGISPEKHDHWYVVNKLWLDCYYNEIVIIAN